MVDLPAIKTLSVVEQRVMSLLRQLDQHHEFKLTIHGFQRGGKREYRLEPSYSEYHKVLGDAEFLAVE